MSYQDIAGWSQIIAMGIFGTVMTGVLVYALRPGNQQKFDAASRLPLLREDDGLSLLSEEDVKGGDIHGR